MDQGTDIDDAELRISENCPENSSWRMSCEVRVAL